MREKIADTIFYDKLPEDYGECFEKADQILALLREEIEMELNGREADFGAVDIDYNEGWKDCRHWTLSLLGNKNVVGNAEL